MGRPKKSEDESVSVGVRINVFLPLPAHEYVTQTAKEEGFSMTDVVRQDLARGKFIRGVEKMNGKIIVELPDGTRQAVVFI